MPSGRRRRRRFIPAQAGNSLARIYRHSRRTVHPRASGEQVRSPSTTSEASGSSPRKRGTGSSTSHSRSCSRFIPAQAGNSCCKMQRPCILSVHPRASGEQSSRNSAQSQFGGSSPRKRGTVGFLDRRLGEPRFIPAQAGNRWRRTAICLGRPVHPRASGEQSRRPSATGNMNGSSPRKRGTVDAVGFQKMADRFIPAQAGNRPSQRTARFFTAVHPRASGEQANDIVMRDGSSGSSPRKRGTVFLCGGIDRPHRFIPAQAGNRGKVRTRGAGPTVHPRASGEQCMMHYPTVRFAGSSPRKRGTDAIGKAFARVGRFIPAQAGNSAGDTKEH